MSSAVYTRFQRNIFTKDTIWNNKDKADALVFKVRGGPAQLDRNLVFLSEFSAG